ncbi:MerR family transcriptional regulator [Streptomyces sp. NPDC047000]|uniref:MerR family transcriptional regulator n=1 Tax=Streptomyces sp. NPDC047000 TaxID=3155474 RepID=UPI0033C95B01
MTGTTTHDTPATAPPERPPTGVPRTPRVETYSLEEVVRISGLDADTLGWYEDQGLIESAGEDPYGVRAYSPVHLRWLEFLNHLRSTGMSPAEMNRYVELYRAGDSTVAARRELLEAHRERVRELARDCGATLRYLDWKIGFYLERETALARAAVPSPSTAEA